VFRPREQEEMIGAEVEHGRNGEAGEDASRKREQKLPPQWHRR
jgi:hypothetical protein